MAMTSVEGLFVDGSWRLDDCAALSIERCSYVRISQVVDPDQLTDEELEATAYVWRRRALHGDRTASGTAHKLEKALRHRKGVFSQVAELDTRPHDLRRRRPWWRFW
jgi:hypothetical protein